MLRITFNHFRCWETLDIKIPIGIITLIRGNSGSGKTTILQGITWCLYGNIRLVAPNHLEKAKTRVILEMPYHNNTIITIDRQKNPNRLLVTHNNNVYEDKVAQSMINDLFGTYDIWLASCYIGQGCRNNFLTAPNTGKMELLNSIAFHEEDPEVYIDKLETLISSTESTYNLKLAQFNQALNNFNSIIANIDVTKALSPQQVEDVNNQISNLTKEEMRLKSLNQQRSIDLGVLNNLQNQLDITCKTNIVIPPPDPLLSTLNDKYKGGILQSEESINNNISRAATVSMMLYRRNELNTEISKLQTTLSSYQNKDIIYTVQDYEDAVKLETTYRENQRIAESCHVTYNESVIKDTITKYQQLLNSQNRLKLQQEKDILQSQIKSLELEYTKPVDTIIFPEIIPRQIPVPDYSQYSTETLRNHLNELSNKQGSITLHIQHLQKGKDVLQCPKCNTSLRYQLGNLLLSDTEAIDKNEIILAQKQLDSIILEITNTNKEISRLISSEKIARDNYNRDVLLETNRINILKDKIKQLELEKQRQDISRDNLLIRINELKIKLNSINESITALPVDDSNITKVLTPKEIEETHSLIGRLSNIRFVSLPSVSSNEIQSYMKYQEIQQKLQTTILMRDEYVQTIDLPFRDASISDVNTYIDMLKIYYKQIKELSQEKIRIDNLKVSLTNQINKLKSNIGPDLTSDITEISNKIIDLKNLISLSIQAHKVLKDHEIITKQRNEVIAINKDLSDLQTLKQYAIETECHILQQTVDSINNSIQGVCSTLFDRDINISLSLFKTLKTTKNVKPVANFAISYQGGLFDNINQMSGGEGDRASLALTLALNRLSACPLLMLDESLASLDLTMKEAAIKTIRENTNNTVLIIMHDGIEGIFQNIINLDDDKIGTKY